MLIAGIDVGKRGGIAFIDRETLRAEVFSMPEDFQDTIRLFFERKDKILRVFIEKQQAFPKQGVVSTFRLGVQYGMLIGLLKVLRIPYEEVPPQRWQKAVLAVSRKNRNQKKALSLQMANALFPDLNIGKHDGKADALLIAEYGRRICL